MNGRLYDPQLRRFLSPDNYVQDSENTQNYNRFGYVYNNPLLYTDPSGEFILEAIIIAVLINGINNMANGIPFWHGMGKAGVSGAISAAITMSIGAAQTAIFNTAKAIALSSKEIIMAGIGQLLSNFMPKIEFNLGNGATFSINIAIIMGNSNGLGLNFQISQKVGDLTINHGFGVNAFSKFQNTGKKGFEFRGSLMASYDDGNFGVSLGTNVWRGAGGMKDFSQRTGMIGLHSGDFRMMYENDGGSGIKDLRLGDRGDSYRTAALQLSVKDFSVGMNLFTGKRKFSRPEDFNEYDKISPIPRDAFNRKFPRGFVDEVDTPYRLGSLTVGYKGYSFGVNSEHIRHAMQDKFIHGLIDDAGFKNQSWDWKVYSQYKTPNIFTSW